MGESFYDSLFISDCILTKKYVLKLTIIHRRKIALNRHIFEDNFDLSLELKCWFKFTYDNCPRKAYCMRIIYQLSDKRV